MRGGRTFPDKARKFGMRKHWRAGPQIGWSDAGGPVFVMQAATNLDRLVSFYRAVAQSGRIFLEDLYQAEAACAAGPSIPQPGHFSNVRVFSAGPPVAAENSQYQRFCTYGKARISRGQVPANSVICIRPSMQRWVERLAQRLPLTDSVLFYSLWSGYRDKPGDGRLFVSVPGTGDERSDTSQQRTRHAGSDPAAAGARSPQDDHPRTHPLSGLVCEGGSNMYDLDRYRGCLLGGAAGDALGYPVEFLSLANIQERYGPAGITSYALQHGVAQISDDTQMTLFTANGLLFSETRRRIGAPGGGSVIGAAAACYRDWLTTQREPVRPENAESHRLAYECSGTVPAPGSRHDLYGGHCPRCWGKHRPPHQPE